jgi:hypothetical protein
LIAAVLLLVAAVVTDVAWLSPDALGIQDGSKVGLAVLAAFAVGGGWKAAQLAAGRGTAALDLWTCVWLGLLAGLLGLVLVQLAR